MLIIKQPLKNENTGTQIIYIKQPNKVSSISIKVIQGLIMAVELVT